MISSKFRVHFVEITVKDEGEAKIKSKERRKEIINSSADIMSGYWIFGCVGFEDIRRSFWFVYKYPYSESFVSKFNMIILVFI